MPKSALEISSLRNLFFFRTPPELIKRLSSLMLQRRDLLFQPFKAKRIPIKLHSETETSKMSDL